MAGEIHLVIPGPRNRRDSRHDCPISGCRISLPPSKLMCLEHWRMLPKIIREAVNAAYAHGTGVGSLALLRAQQAAVDAVEKRLAEEAHLDQH